MLRSQLDRNILYAFQYHLGCFRPIHLQRFSLSRSSEEAHRKERGETIKPVEGRTRKENTVYGWECKESVHGQILSFWAASGGPLYLWRLLQIQFVGHLPSANRRVHDAVHKTEVTVLCCYGAILPPQKWHISSRLQAQEFTRELHPDYEGQRFGVVLLR